MTVSGPTMDRGEWSVITVNVCDYDVIRPVPSDATSVDWVYVTDRDATAERAASLGWRTVVMPQSDQTPFLQSRIPKTSPQEFTDRSYSVYVDARFLVETEGVVDDLSAYLGPGAWLALFSHDDRHSIYDEAEECRRLKISTPEMDAQISHYRAIDVQHSTGLWCGGVLVRRHGVEQAEFGRAWLQELAMWQTRDQLSLPVVLERCDVVPAEIPGSLYAWPGLQITPHLVRRPGVTPFRRSRALGARLKRMLR